MEKATPPVYTANVPQNNDGAPPAYTFPNTFRIGIRKTEGSLVDVEQLKGHLGLLHLFYGLREKVEAGDDDRFPTWTKELEPERRWAWFATLAAERFERWSKDVHFVPLSTFVEENLPPLDVIMVWHAYLLNPGWYYEDTLRLPCLRGLCMLNEIFATSMANIDELVSAKPSKLRIENWTQRTSTPFHPLDAAAVLEDRAVRCPKCRKTVIAPLYNAEGTGYAQQKFKITCECSFEIDKDKLGAAKYVQNLTRGNADKNYDGHLAGTLFTPTNNIDVVRAKLVKSTILQPRTLSNTNRHSPKGPALSGEAWERQILDMVDYSRERLKALAASKMKGGGGRLLNRIMSAYTDDSIFSIDLAGAVLRQSSFVKKMHDLRWTEPSYFDSKDDEVVLQHCVARYHAFLDLMTSSPTSFFVPTLDIDLAWHTHQLRAKQYSHDTLTYVRRFVDHDDKIEETYLSNAFDLTCRAWQSRFHVAYMHCGCPLPGDTIGQKLSSKLKLNNNSQKPSYLLPPENPDILQATHPSDHNSVFAFHHEGQSEASRRNRRAKALKRRQRDAENVQKGKLDREAYERGDGHGQAFLMPIPLYYGYAACGAFYGGVYGSGVGACAAGAGGCAAGGTACGSGGGCGSGGCGGGGGGCGGGGGGGCGGGGGG